MWHEFGRLRQQPPLPPISATGGREEGKESGGIDPGIWSFFWNGSSKELPAAYINHPQLAQRGNSICRELYTFYRGTFSHQAIYSILFQEPGNAAGGCNVLLLQKSKRGAPHPPRSREEEKKNSLNKSPVSSCVFRWCPVCSAEQGDLTLTLPQRNLLRRCNPIQYACSSLQAGLCRKNSQRCCIKLNICVERRGRKKKKHTLLGNNRSALKENEFLPKIQFKVVIFISVKWDLRTKHSLRENKNRANR